jgi:hypothetical protein
VLEHLVGDEWLGHEALRPHLVGSLPSLRVSLRGHDDSLGADAGVAYLGERGPAVDHRHDDVEYHDVGLASPDGIHGFAPVWLG